MNFSFIVPEAYLSLLKLTTYHLVLPTYYLGSKEYRTFFKKAKERGDHLILDNGFYELKGKSLGWQALLDICCDLKPNVLVTPDVDPFTPSGYDENLSWCEYASKEENSSLQFMHVLKGEWFTDLEDELNYIRNADSSRLYISWIGIHKDHERFGKGNINGRRAIVLGLEDLLEGYKIHMLGIYKNPVEEVLSFKDLDNVKGCDSRKPWRICSLGRKIKESRALPDKWNFKQKIDSSVETFVASQFSGFLGMVRS